MYCEGHFEKCVDFMSMILNNNLSSSYGCSSVLGRQSLLKTVNGSYFR